MNSKDIRDPWGTDYHFMCGPFVTSHGRTTLIVTSAGEDGQFGTRDDIWSDR